MNEGCFEMCIVSVILTAVPFVYLFFKLFCFLAICHSHLLEVQKSIMFFLLSKNGSFLSANVFYHETSLQIQRLRSKVETFE